MVKASTAVLTALIGLALGGCSSTVPLQVASRAGMRFIEHPGDTWECKILSKCPVIVVKVRANSDPAPDQGGPGLCQPGVVYGAYVVHTLGLFERDLVWELDDAAKREFEFADPGGVFFVRNEVGGKPAFDQAVPDGNKHKYKSKSNGRVTAPPSDPSAPGFGLRLVRKSNGKACGEVDPPIVNQP